MLNACMNKIVLFQNKIIVLEKQDRLNHYTENV